MPKSKKPLADECMLPWEDLPDPGEIPFKFKMPRQPVWTADKAALVALYLKFFCYVTKHGTYIDAFAGPQRLDCENMWSAKLVLETEPQRLRHFYLFEQHSKGIKKLEVLKASQRPRDKSKGDPKRDIQIIPGDCNLNLPALLNSNPIRPKEATFCLLDQRTFECTWAMVETVARYKTSGPKIEIFYFWPYGWLARSLRALKGDEKLRAWWGRDDCDFVRNTRARDLMMHFTDRFKTELGYRYSTPWPIYQGPQSNRIMYYMIHAADHSDAPKLMQRAYGQAVKHAILSNPSAEQMDLFRPTSTDIE